MKTYEYLPYTASANFAPSAFTDWVDEQTVMTASDVVAPAAPVFAPGDIEGVNQGIKLTLHAPTLNADGTPCQDFGHFRVFYNTTTPVGTSFHVETSASSYTMPTEVPLHFAVAAVDVRGNVGAVSGEQSASPIFTTGGAGEIAIQGWQSDIEFTAATHNKVNWAAGRIWLMDGKTYSIVAGNTGIMSALTFIYLDIGVSNTVLQTTTSPRLAVGRGKILVGVADNAPDASKSATFQIFSGSGGQGVLIGTNNIKAGSVTANLVAANEIITNTANISDAVISSAKIISLEADKVDAISLSAISADLGTINAGTITGALLRTAATGWRVEMQSGAIPLRYWNGATTRFSVDSSGNVAIAGAITILSGTGVGNLTDAGTLATRNTVAGVHIDSNAVTAAKINVATLSAITANLGTITAGTITGALLRTAATGWRVEMRSGAIPLRYWNGTTTRFSIDSSGNIAITGALTAGSGSSIDGSYVNNINADTITAGTITGRMLQTATSGSRILIAPSWGGHTHILWGIDSNNINRASFRAGYIRVGRMGPHASVHIRSLSETTASILIRAGGGRDGMTLDEKPSIVFHHPGTIGGINSANMVTLQNTIGRMSVFTGSWSVVLGTGWTNISLVNVVGSRRGLVFLRVRNRAGGPRNLRFRPDGDTQTQHPHANTFPGACSTRVDTVDEFNYVWVLTSSAGVIEASADATVTVIIEPLAFIT